VMLSSDALETASISEQFSKLNIHFVGYWWTMNKSDEAVCTKFHVTVEDVTSAKQADL
jgi:hypothetical protein